MDRGDTLPLPVVLASGLFYATPKFAVSIHANLKLKSRGLPGVLHRLVRLHIKRKRHGLLRRDQHDIEGAFFEHGGELALALGEGEGFGYFVPVEVDAGEVSFFVAVSEAVVFVEGEVAI